MISLHYLVNNSAQKDEFPSGAFKASQVTGKKYLRNWEGEPSLPLYYSIHMADIHKVALQMCCLFICDLKDFYWLGEKSLTRYSIVSEIVLMMLT